MDRKVLATSERVSIVNALMAEDRIEIREKRQMAMTLTYYVIPGLIAVTAFAVDNPQLKWILLFGDVILTAMYVVAFLVIKRWLHHARTYLIVREAYFKEEQSLLFADPFEPLRHVTAEDYKQDRIGDTHLWIPFSVTLLSSIVLMCYILLFVSQQV